MRFDHRRVTTQVQLMVERWMNDELVDIAAGGTGKVCREVETVIEDYIDRFRDVENEAERLLFQKNIDGEVTLKRAVEAVANTKSFPVYDAAFDFLNKEIEKALWDSEYVEELYAEPHQLVAVNTPYLKAMTGREIL
ncbi:MAG: hypothetical protein H6728_02760 [Myxococcales bacterium]|nr:hypothetical protein [Myxococcales bacterium]MCB9641974.1 hypothetical protein [Myxococcales bacterium]